MYSQTIKTTGDICPNRHIAITDDKHRERAPLAVLRQILVTANGQVIMMLHLCPTRVQLSIWSMFKDSTYSCFNPSHLPQHLKQSRHTIVIAPNHRLALSCAESTPSLPGRYSEVEPRPLHLDWWLLSWKDYLTKHLQEALLHTTTTRKSCRYVDDLNRGS
ncbi:hypothetical protein B0H34DRAFT_255336 [Crassisporium funariophilum]|nr:hypothetical protein B0H34DRAFT_255336 [Crassisporium funariophilum]